MDWAAPLSVIFPPVQGAVLYALWRRPVPMTGRQVHLLSGTGSYPGTLAALGRLTAQGLVTARAVGRASEYALNTDHVLYPVVDAALGAFSPREHVDRRLRDLVRQLVGEHVDEVTLAYFGSFARGEARLDSDIDVLLVLPDAFPPDREDAVVEEIERSGRRWTGNRVQVYVTRPAALARAVEAGDPIVDSWDREAQPLIGPSIQRRLRALRRTSA